MSPVVLGLLRDHILQIFRGDTGGQFPSGFVSTFTGKNSCKADMNSSSCNSAR